MNKFNKGMQKHLTGKIIDNIIYENKFSAIEKDYEMREAEKSRNFFKIDYPKLVADGRILPISVTSETDFADKKVFFTFMGMQRQYTQKYYGQLNEDKYADGIGLIMDKHVGLDTKKEEKLIIEGEFDDGRDGKFTRSVQ